MLPGSVHCSKRLQVSLWCARTRTRARVCVVGVCLVMRYSRHLALQAKPESHVEEQPGLKVRSSCHTVTRVLKHALYSYDTYLSVETDWWD